MTKLKYMFTNDGLFKLLFVKYPHLLKMFVAALLGIPYDSIKKFAITNPEIQPETLGDKFCRLDINMDVDGRSVDLEVQVEDQKNYVDRSAYYLSRKFSTALSAAGDYVNLPPSIVISILAFPLFGCAEFHSEFRFLEVTRHEQLTDKLCLHYFELPKIPKDVNKEDGQLLWLSLFNSETEEDILKIQKMGVPIMEQVIEAYRHVSASDELKEIERMRERAHHDEISALASERRIGLAEGMERGMARGMERGKREQALNIARNMLNSGMDVDDAAKFTGLTVEDLLRL